MAQRENPYLNRLGYNKDWNVSFIYKNKKEQSTWLAVNKFISDTLYNFFPEIVELKFEYYGEAVFVKVFLMETRFLIGEGSPLTKVIDIIDKELKKYGRFVRVDLIEIKYPYANHSCIALIICNKIKQRSSLKSVVRDVLRNVSLENSVKGIKIEVNGRIGGSEMAQKKKFSEGNISSSTLDEDVDFGFRSVVTTYGSIGVRVTLCKRKQNLFKNKINKSKPPFLGKKRYYADSKKN